MRTRVQSRVVTRCTLPASASPLTTPVISAPLSSMTESDPPGRAFVGQPAARQRIADHVFESLAKAILSGDLKPGEPVPTQRELALQLNVSALVVRQAIHRLEDLGLVRVRQGSSTIVLDPNDSRDIRLVQLRFELAEPGMALSIAAWENQALFVVPLLVLAERRITEDELARLHQLIDDLGESPTPEAARRFRIDFWRQIAASTRNPLFQQQVRWWSTLIAELEQRGRKAHVPGLKLDPNAHRRLLATLAAKKGAAQAHLEAIRPLLDWMEASREGKPR
jgi:DNA-binding FadR family transcriptional regulator